VVAKVAKMVDPTERIAENEWTAIINRLPYARQLLPPKIDQFGRETGRTRAGSIAQIVDIMYSQPDRTDDPIIAEMQRVGAEIGRLRRDKEEETRDYVQRQVAEGVALYEALGNTINGELYQMQLELAERMVKEHPAFKDRDPVELAMEWQKDLIEGVSRELRSSLTTYRREAEQR